MTVAELLDYCLAKPGAWQDEPWEGDLVAKVGDESVGGKIFAFLGSGDAVGVKCGGNRDEADEWLMRYPDEEIRAAVDDSYDLVVAKLPKKQRPEGWVSR